MTELERLAPRLARAHAARIQEIEDRRLRREAFRRGMAQTGKSVEKFGAAFKRVVEALERASKSIGELSTPLP